MRQEALRPDELEHRIKELEERTGAFQREAISGAHLISQLEATLSVAEQARRKLEAVVARQSAELQSWRQEASAQKVRLEAAEKLLAERLAALVESERRYEQVCAAFAAEVAKRERIQAEAGIELKRALEAEREKMRAELKTVMKCAEAVRREGIEALEQARELKK